MYIACTLYSTGIPFNAQSLRRSRSRGSRSNYSNMPPPESGNEPHPFMDDDPGRQSFDEVSNYMKIHAWHARNRRRQTHTTNKRAATMASRAATCVIYT